MVFLCPTVLDIVALAVTVVSVALQYLSFFYPEWWSYKHVSSALVERTKTVGMYQTVECLPKCETKLLVNIEGDYEWLFISRIFEVFACFLCILALFMHVLYLPIRKEGVRSVAIYLLGAAGLFALGGSFVFAALYDSLGDGLAAGTHSASFPFGINILAGFLHILASALTAVATVKAAGHGGDSDMASIV
ncbi:uncharacterized protein LOC110448452 [Mizuhopecten yessoensis]|uniref:Transmembrane protein n=1 Tax=Mizuhopecten yessoensis TaxID=6573 RepID=A0A210QTC0_MIZYE|nr:uncharacterized protein LOC110448452 [Mizuhopecten yessoensis]OWF51965.1 hypothetical protein KP79_PYT18459 [Mizuhopecten yessoensis]